MMLSEKKTMIWRDLSISSLSGVSNFYSSQ